MNSIDLSFDTEQMIAGLQQWVETESPGTDATAVNKVIDLAAYEFSTLAALADASIERIPGRIGLGDTLKARFNPATSSQIDRPGILICLHADTVHETGSLATTPYRREGNSLWGAGIASTKAGLYLCIEAMRQLIQNNNQFHLPITVLILPDKELGCPATRELIEAVAKRQKYVLVPGTVADQQTIYNGRHAELRYQLDVKVDSASEIYKQSALSEMAQHIVAIDQLNTSGCRFKVGAIQSGQWVKFAEKCTAQVISEAISEADVDDSVRRMMALNSPNPDKGLHVNRSVCLPLWKPATNQLLENVLQVANAQGLKLHATIGAGGSLSNITGAMGIETIDGIGVVGSNSHSRAERIQIDSLAARAHLIASLLMTLQ